MQYFLSVTVIFAWWSTLCSAECGKSALSPISYIVNGRESRPHDWPWAVSVQFKRTYYHGHTCGGTLISDSFVVTSAHCFRGRDINNMSLWRVVLGLHRRSDEPTSARVQVAQVAEIISHPEWDYSTKSADYALMRLAQPVTINEHVNNICMPPTGWDGSNDDYECVAVGWGSLQEQSQPTNELREAPIPLVDRQNCQLHYNPTLGHDMTKLCAGGSPQRTDTCAGDSGGPYMCRRRAPRPGQPSQEPWLFIGVTSYGIGCGSRPGIYANVSYFVSWTIAQMNPSATPNPSEFEECGTRAATFRVIWGEPAQLGQIPWQVLIENDGRFRCGGTLISNEWVLTLQAYHWNFTVGKVHRNSHDATQQSRRPAAFYSHPDYSSRTFSDDIALVRLASPVKLNNWVRTACLPQTNLGSATHESQCLVSGWGETRLDTTSTTLQMGLMQPRSDYICQAFYNQQYVPSKMLCAGRNDFFGGSPQTCSGDSGGPMACKTRQGRFEIQGIISFGAAECSRAPSAFTQVYTYLNWIRRTINDGLSGGSAGIPAGGLTTVSTSLTTPPPTCPTAITSSWTSWSGCSVSCGNGYQTRQRTIWFSGTNAAIFRRCSSCQPESVIRACVRECPSTWASWSDWSQCRGICDQQSNNQLHNGIKYRSRACPQTDSIGCVGDPVQIQSCMLINCGQPEQPAPAHQSTRATPSFQVSTTTAGSNGCPTNYEAYVQGPITIQSPRQANGRYPPYANCNWRLLRSTSFVGFDVRILHLEIEYDAYCRYDSLRLRSNRRQVYMCSGIAETRQLYFEGASLQIQFTSDGSTELNGFILQITPRPRAVETTSVQPVESTTTTTTTTTTTPQRTRELFRCIFDQGLCYGINIQESPSNFTWMMQASGNNRFLEASAPQPVTFKEAYFSVDLDAVLPNQVVREACLKFNAIIYGDALYFLKVNVYRRDVNPTPYSPWIRSSFNDSRWYQQSISLRVSHGIRKIEWKAFCGFRLHGDIAVDNIIVERGVC